MALQHSPPTFHILNIREAGLGAISHGSQFIQLALNDGWHNDPDKGLKKEPEDIVVVLLDICGKSFTVFPPPIEIRNRDYE